MGALSHPDGAPRRPSRFRPRYRTRLRRALPALVLLLALSLLAGGVWLRVLDRVDAGASTAAAGCASAGTAAVRRIQVRVYNSTVREGLARSVADQLRGRGFVVITTANDPLVDIRDVRVAAEVRYGPAGRQAGRAGPPAGAGGEAVPGRPGGRRRRPRPRPGVQAAGHRGRAGQGPAGAARGWSRRPRSATPAC